MHQGNHHFHYLLNRELSEIYITIALRAFALSLITIFLPIYLYQNHFPLNQVFLFFAIMYGVASILNLASAKLCSKLGYKHLMALSMPFLVLGYLVLIFVKGLGGMAFASAILFSIAISLFWLAFHTDFATFSKKKQRGKQVGGYLAVSALATILGPVVGGLILRFTTFNILFIIVSVLLCLSTVPLFFSKEVYPKHKFSFKTLRKQFKLSRVVWFSSYSAPMILIAIVWPLFIFLIVKQYLYVGILMSVASVFAFLFTFIIGVLSDKHNKERLLRSGSGVNTGLSLFRILVKTAPHVLAMNFFYGIIAPFIQVNFNSFSYDIARKNRLELIVFREIVFGASRACSLFLLFLIPNFFFAFTLVALFNLVLAFSSYK